MEERTLSLEDVVTHALADYVYRECRAELPPCIRLRDLAKIAAETIDNFDK